MLRVGLTGGIGAGKSEVARLLAERGAVVVDADQIAHAVTAPGTPGHDAVVAAFGPAVVDDGGSLDRERLAALVFADHDARRRLEAIVHPLVREQRARIATSARPDAVLVEDVPLLVENGMAGEFDVVVVVEAPASERLARLWRHRRLPGERARARMAAQATDEERRRVADVVIENAGTLTDLAARVDELWERLAGAAG